MKKNFEIPAMQISSFDVENIVTASNPESTSTNVENAEAAIVGAKYTTRVSFNNIGFTF